MLEKDISRRTLLKVIAAGCSVVVASSLPRDWVKPVIDAGLLPVHAQTTSGGTITGEVWGCGSGSWAPSVNATVTLLVGSLPYSAGTTDGDGAFVFAGIPTGTYDLHADDGYNSYDFTGVVVTAGTTTNVGNMGSPGC